MSSIVFIRGFNSYKTDHIRFGPIDFGLAHTKLQAEFSKHEIDLSPIRDIGHGDIEDQIQKALQQIIVMKNNGILKNDVHLLGYSAGGIIARGLAHKILQNEQLQIGLKSVITLTSPNRGSNVAEILSTNALDTKKLTKQISLFNKNERQKQVLHWTKERIEKFNALYPDLPNLQYASITSAVSSKNMPAPLKLLRIWHGINHIPSDGIVELESQPWGKVIRHFDLDHGSVIGLRTVM